MPLYEYLCADCGHRFEFLQALGAGTEDLSCPSCAKGNLEKQFSTFAGKSSSGAGGDSVSAGGCGAPSGFT